MKMPPDKVTSLADRGDDVLRRFRYQITYSAIVALSLLDDKTGVSEVFCEHHEDILVKLVGGKFVGVQVKTRELGLGPFSTSDETIFNCLKKFINLELQFPKKFKRFTIVTNNGFYSVDESSKNLSWIIKLAKAKNHDKLLAKRTKTKKLVSDLAAECDSDVEVVIGVLSKTELKGDTAGLDHILQDLEYRLNKIPKLNGQTTSVISQVAQKLVNLNLNASSLVCEFSVTEDYINAVSVDDEKIRKVIDGKRLTKEIVIKAIEECAEEPISLLAQDQNSLKNLSKESKRLIVKMDKGGISYDNVSLQKDNKYAAESNRPANYALRGNSSDILFTGWVGMRSSVERSHSNGLMSLILQVPRNE